MEMMTMNKKLKRKYKVIDVTQLIASTAQKVLKDKPILSKEELIKQLKALDN